MLSTIIAGLVLKTLQAHHCKVALALMPQEPLNEASYIKALQEQAGLQVQSLYVSLSWKELDNNGTFNPKPLADQIGICKFLGVHPVICIKTLDTNNRNLPPDVATKAFDSAEMQQRWTNFIGQLAKQLPPDISAVSLGNEVDIYLGDHPTELAPYAKFLAIGKQKLRSEGVRAPIGVVTTFDGLENRKELVKNIQASQEAVFTTYYPMEGFQVQPVSNVPDHFKQMTELAAGKSLYLTEMGYPAAAACGSSDASQAEFVHAVFKQLSLYDRQIAFASYFVQTDFGDSFLDMFENYYHVKNGEFRAFLGSLGLTTTTGNRRPAYEVFAKDLYEWRNLK